MKKALFTFTAVFVICIILFSPAARAVYAFDPVESENRSTALRKKGEVLYHQDFSDIYDFGQSGLIKGTNSSQSSVCECTGDELGIRTEDNGRVYVILPYTGTGDSYTVEFDFSFTEIKADNGYISFMLTCRGTEPTNITSITIRADGSVDDFGVADEAVAAAMSAGKKIHCRIPIEGRILHEIELSSEEASCVLERSSLLKTDDGERGFSVRNASIAISEIYIVHGVGYTKLSGVYADSSYATNLHPAGSVAADETPGVTDVCAGSSVPTSVNENEPDCDKTELSPPTEDHTVTFTAAAMLSAAALWVIQKSSGQKLDNT